jgi:cbb3-type cytochrome oxidase maturation protein
MSAIIVLIFIGIIVAGGFLAAFIWAVKSGQYDDDYSPSVRMLFDSKRDEKVRSLGDEEGEKSTSAEH